MIPLTNGENQSFSKQKVSHICKTDFSIDNEDKKYRKVIDHCNYTGKYRGTAHNIGNLKYKTSRKIPAIFHNGSKYDYHFIIKELAEKSRGQFECLGENTEKYVTFSVPINKELENNKTITYRIKFFESFRFMSSPLSSLVDNLSGGLHNNECKDCKSCLEYISTKDELAKFNCLKCSKKHKKHFNKYLIRIFANTYEFCDDDKFVCFL